MVAHSFYAQLIERMNVFVSTWTRTKSDSRSVGVGGRKKSFDSEVGNSVIIPASWRGSLAQLVEQRTLNPLVEGSNPSRPTINSMKINDFLTVSLGRGRNG